MLTSPSEPEREAPRPQTAAAVAFAGRARHIASLHARMSSSARFTPPFGASVILCRPAARRQHRLCRGTAGFHPHGVSAPLRFCRHLPGGRRVKPSKPIRRFSRWIRSSNEPGSWREPSLKRVRWALGSSTSSSRIALAVGPTSSGPASAPCFALAIRSSSRVLRRANESSGCIAAIRAPGRRADAVWLVHTKPGQHRVRRCGCSSGPISPRLATCFYRVGAYCESRSGTFTIRQRVSGLPLDGGDRAMLPLTGIDSDPVSGSVGCFAKSRRRSAPSLPRPDRCV
jgi:hypothetical protein